MSKYIPFAVGTRAALTTLAILNESGQTLLSRWLKVVVHVEKVPDKDQAEGWARRSKIMEGVQSSAQVCTVRADRFGTSPLLDCGVTVSGFSSFLLARCRVLRGENAWENTHEAVVRFFQSLPIISASYFSIMIISFVKVPINSNSRWSGPPEVRNRRVDHVVNCTHAN